MSERPADRWIADRMGLIESSGIRRVFELARSLTDPINLSIGQPDFDVPAPIKAADTVKVKFTPPAPRSGRGKQLQAVISLGSIEAGDLSKVMIRERR